MLRSLFNCRRLPTRLSVALLTLWVTIVSPVYLAAQEPQSSLHRARVAVKTKKSAPEFIKIHHIPYQRLDKAAERWGLLQKIIPSEKKGRACIQLITQSGRSVRWEFLQNNREAFFDGIKTFLGFVPIIQQDAVYVAQSDVESTLAPLATQAHLKKQKHPVCILIDPGHGGRDRGTTLGKIQEKDLCLKIAKKLETRLKAKRYKVILTRSQDEAMSLDDRAHKAQQVGADMVISLHLNSAENPTAQGIETFAYTPRSQPSTSQPKIQANDHSAHPGHHSTPQNTCLAHQIQKHLIKATGAPDRGGPRYSRLKLLRLLNSQKTGHPCPGVLVELGFLSHPEEGAKLQSPPYQDRLVEGLVKGIEAYASGG